ncbi:hypothetical protein KC343_g5560 [Hortaea werneckii]|nr:hypothetical protein KC323_g7028 [Hortaea werneckii]KAI7262706.1 hypothetical protein KC352_g9688 [Hortaea werneckii]KAI7566082.1 hypothetical protein KC317_g5907 [Hortaea werneckii]KAI7616989.1 hypothetical protein KC346_g5712 [Hortaea werneckii]KAI7628882.1 hypothetical protein KC343_g5560 [Hortaea werneckii]
MFTYYNHQLIDTCAQSLHNKAEARSHLGGLLESRLGKPSKQYDAPLRGICPEAPYDERLKFFTPVDFTMISAAGRMFLRRWQEPGHRGSGINFHSFGESGPEDNRGVMKVFFRIDGDEDPFDETAYGTSDPSRSISSANLNTSIRIAADLWLKMNKRIRVKVGASKEKFTVFEQVPGMKTLALVASRVDQIVNTDEVEAGSFKDSLEDEVRKIRKGSATNMAPGNPKQAADQDGEGEKET